MNRSSKILRYVSRRLIQGIPIILAIVVLNFFLLNLAEGDAVDVLAGEAGSATPEYMEEMRKKFGLDKPLPVQLAVYLKNVIQLDLGYSFRHDMQVTELIIDRFWPTLILMVSTILLAVGFGILLGLFAAINLKMSSLEDLQTHYVFKHSVLSNMICCLSFRVPPGRGAAGAESVCFEIARFVFLICECRVKDEMLSII